MTLDPGNPRYLGCAGWSLPREQWPHFAEGGTHLQRYASRFNAVEINSSFYRPHRPATYARWAASVPASFRFSVKMPRQITHDARLVDCETGIRAFFEQCSALGDRLGCILVQLPPSLAYEEATASRFFQQVRLFHEGPVVLEPRHRSWLAAGPVLMAARVGWVQADPAPLGETQPLGWPELLYWRLHGTPRVYYSAYGSDVLGAMSARLRHAQVPAWCIFDNTAAGAAVPNALEVLSGLQS